jgi:hypothetical protein
MEIVKQKNPFENCGKDAVQEWLVHPVTVATRELLVEIIKVNEKQALASMRDFPQKPISAEQAGIRAKNIGSILLGLDEALGLFDWAKEYANGK